MGDSKITRRGVIAAAAAGVVLGVSQKNKEKGESPKGTSGSGESSGEKPKR